MKFSLFCMNTYADPALFGPEHTAYPMPAKNYDPDVGLKSFAVTLGQAQLAEEIGFDWVSASEHHGWHIQQSPNGSLLLAAIAQATDRVKIAWMGPLVSMNNPIRVAEECALLDQISGGRLIILPLRGTPNEFLSYGVKADETRPRAQEAMALIHRVLTARDPFSWQGRFFQFRTASIWPALTQHPMLPVLWSGNSLESATYAAKNGFGMAMSYYPPQLIADLVSFYRSECDRYGWTPSSEQILYRCFAGVGESDEHAQDMEARFYGGGLGLRASQAGRGKAMASHLKVPEPPKKIGTDADRGGTTEKGASGFSFGQLTFKGSAETVIRQIREFVADTGVGVIDVAFNGGGLSTEESYDSLRRFGEDVIPHVRDTVAVEPKEVSSVAR